MDTADNNSTKKTPGPAYQSKGVSGVFVFGIHTTDHYRSTIFCG
jgi:hypothetical protein